jgi:hypothetical protein
MTSDDFPVEEPTEEQLTRFAVTVEQEQLRQKIERIYGTGETNADPAAAPTPTARRGPPRS